MSLRAGWAFNPVGSVLLWVAACSAPLKAQMQLAGTGGGGLHIITTDLAVLEAQDVRKDLPCTVTPDKPGAGLRSPLPCRI